MMQNERVRYIQAQADKGFSLINKFFFLTYQLLIITSYIFLGHPGGGGRRYPLSSFNTTCSLQKLTTLYNRVYVLCTTHTCLLSKSLNGLHPRLHIS